MDKYEKLLHEAESEGIVVDENYHFKGRTSGLYIDGNIALSDKLKTVSEKSCILAEELGHHYTSAGNIIDMADVSNRKQERRARLWAYNKQICLDGLYMAFVSGCRNRYEIAEFLGVTEEFFDEALAYYATIYPNGHSNSVLHYTIKFVPNLQVLMFYD